MLEHQVKKMEKVVLRYTSMHIQAIKIEKYVNKKNTMQQVNDLIKRAQIIRLLRKHKNALYSV